MIVIICGGRDLTDGEFVFSSLDQIHSTINITRIIEGGQRTKNVKTGKVVGGADYWAFKWAEQNRIHCITVKANWNMYGAAAGPIRNQEMINRYNPKRLIAFPGGKGTADMKRRAKKAGIEVIEVNKKPATGTGFFTT